MTLSEERLRRRIRSTFHLDDPRLPPAVARRAEEEALALIRAFAKAPEWQKNAVYEQGERKLLQLLRKARGNRSIEEHSSSNSV